jgi:ABC-2 type transport system ATP-binding protein
LRDKGKSIFLSSHQLSDVELVCDRVAILNFGRLVKTGKVTELIEGSRTEIIARGVSDPGIAALRQVAPELTQKDGYITLVHEDLAAVNQIVDIVRQHEGVVVSVVPQRRRLEDIFVETVGIGTGRTIGTFNELTGGRA